MSARGDGGGVGTKTLLSQGTNKSKSEKGKSRQVEQYNQPPLSILLVYLYMEEA